MTNDKEVILRPTEIADLEKLFVFQTDEDAIFLAAFTPKDPTDKTAYIDKYTKLLVDPTVNNQTIVVNNQIAGSVAAFVIHGETEITYWLDRPFWGNGIATAALRQFLKIENRRPIVGRVAFDNFGSQRVLEKCGFAKTGSDKGFANARQKEIEEYIYKLS